MEDEARAFRPRIEALRKLPDHDELEGLEEDMLGFFDRVLDTADRARSAVAERRTEEYLAALDLLAECRPS